MDHYNDNLRHFAEPATPSERRSAISTQLVDYSALYLREILHEWATRVAEDEDRASIAFGYVEFIGRKVVENRGHRYVTIYAHTETAADVLADAFEEWKEDQRERDQRIHGSLARVIEEGVIVDVWGAYQDDTEEEAIEA